MTQPDLWQISIDTGGTFTDAIGVDPQGRVHRAKVLSNAGLRGVLRSDKGTLRLELPATVPSDWLRGFSGVPLKGEQTPFTVRHHDPRSGRVELDGEVAPLIARLPLPVELRFGDSAPRLAMALLLGVSPQRLDQRVDLRFATTRATNALLERTVEPIAFFATDGFADLLRIGDQSRPEIFAARIDRPPPLHAAVVEVKHRLEPDGSTRIPLDEAHLRSEALRLRDRGISTAAIALLHAPAHSECERVVAEILRRCGFTRVVCSSDLSNRPGFLDRARTAVAEAALADRIETFIAAIATPEEPVSIAAMTSSGGLVPAATLRACESLLSGPAAGVVGAGAIARACGFEQALAFDMGGTSTDVSRLAGDLRRRALSVVGGERIALPSIEIETVAAGGGSIAWLRDDGLAEVGPRSAGADPGPACYGRGGPLTVTDINLLLGRVDRSQFGVPLDELAAERAATQLFEAHRAAHPASPLDRVEFLEALRAIADERMAGAIEQVSTRQGFEPADHALVAFGGAGGQHAAAIADRLGISTILVPAAAGVLSALGLRHAVRRRLATASVLRPLDGGRMASDDPNSLAGLARDLAATATEGLCSEGVPRSRVELAPTLAFLRLAGQESTLELPLEPIDTIPSRFAAAFRAHCGYEMPPRPIEVESLRAEAFETAPPPDSLPAAPPIDPPPPRRLQRLRSGGQWVDAGVWHWSDLAPGTRLEGPALIADRTATAVIDAAWTAEIRGDGSIVATRRGGNTSSSTVRTALRPELLAARLASIAEEMGERLRRTALSVNIKHRLDYSTAILDGAGHLVETAAHLPVHLGALGMAARAVLQTCSLAPGDTIVLNHPAFGGSHLPDVTLLTPLFRSGRASPIAILANRAHHAEIGGVLPGSMAPTARTLAEEGVAIAPMHLVRQGRAEWAAVESLLRNAPFPSRSPQENLADLQAQLAANELGTHRLAAVIDEIGEDAFERGLADLAARGAAAVAAALPELLPTPAEQAIALDDGTPIRVRLEQREGRLIVDFAGSGPRHRSNLNAPLAVVHSAVLYTLRLLIGLDLPLNEGLMRCVDLRVPSGLLNPAFTGDAATDPAVAAGNTETSQRVVEALLLAFGRLAPGQSTMNNVLVGDRSFGVYETLAGGAGAGPGFEGASAVHTHMTNTRISDAEFIERAYPVRIDRFEIRRSSGGGGRWRGGDGVRRVYRFERDLDLSIISQHRTSGPPGLAGGGSGAPGSQKLLRADGSIEPLGALATCRVDRGDRLEILTPGGGGWGGVADTVE